METYKSLFRLISILLIGLAALPLAATDLEVLAAQGVVAPEGLKAGQKLAAGTRLQLEPWGRAVIREATNCKLTHVVVGVEDYSLALSEDCSQGEDPMSIVGRIQQGDVFAGRIDEAQDGPGADVITALRHDACTYLPRVSEEGGGYRQCPSGYALRGLRCTGSWCDNKDLMCCPYLDGAPDPDAKAVQARQISDEFPNSMTSKRFLNGLTCYSAYCDDVVPHAFKSPRVTNTRTCDWTAWDSEQRSTWLVCGADQFIAGMRCRDDYCGDVGVYCCQAKME